MHSISWAKTAYAILIFMHLGLQAMNEPSANKGARILCSRCARAIDSDDHSDERLAGKIGALSLSDADPTQRELSDDFKSFLIDNAYEREIPRGGDSAISVSFSHDNKLLALGSNYINRVDFVDVENGATLFQLPHAQWSRGALFSPNGKLIAAGAGAPNKFWIIDRESKEKLFEVPSNDYVCSEAVIFSADSKFVATGDRTCVRIIDCENKVVACTLNYGRLVGAVAFSADGKLLATGSHNNKACVTDWQNNRVLLEMDHGTWVDCVALSPNGKLLATGAERTLRLIDCESKEVIFQDRGEVYYDQPKNLMFSPNGVLLVVLGYAKSKKGYVFNCERKERAFAARGDYGAFNADGALLATTEYDQKMAYVTDCVSGELLYTVRTGWNLSVALSPDGLLLATAGDNPKIWRLATHKAVSAIAKSLHSAEQLKLLKACEKAMSTKQPVSLDQEQLSTLNKLPEPMQRALRKHCVVKE